MNTNNRSTNYPEAQTGAADELRDAVSPPRRLSDDDPHPMQIEIYRQMTPGRRLEIAEQMYWSARRMKSAWLKAQHADWSDVQIEAEVTRIFSNARS